MCAINGVFEYRLQGQVDREEIVRTRDYMRTRGPDSLGAWTSSSGHIGFGHRRLAIVDLTEAGHQPMSTADGRTTVVFNGEIYNYQRLRECLKAEGAEFRSHCDTEVLLHLYRRRGYDMFRELRGMYAFALWDTDEQTLLLARDPYGIKPLYYADDGRTLRFASSVKALLAGGAIARDTDPSGVVGFHLFGSVPEPWTTHRAIKSIPAGTYATTNARGFSGPKRHYSLASQFCPAKDAKADAEDSERLFREALLDSVRHHIVADVPVGVFLSGGVDSTALLGLMRDAGQKDIQTVTLAFDAFRGGAMDEVPLAKSMAERYGARHEARFVTRKEFQQDLPAIIHAMDQPSMDGVNTWFVSKAASELGLKVALSGIGGDELIGGYSTFDRLPRLVQAMRCVPSIPGGHSLFSAALCAGRMSGLPAHPKLDGLYEYGRSYAGAYLLQRGVYLPEELSSILTDMDMVEEGLKGLIPLDMIARELDPEPRQPHAKVAVLESALYLRNQLLRDTDWAGMAHSIEIRTPFVDSVLLSEVAPLFANGAEKRGKTMLAHAPQTPLPGYMLARAKVGFTVPVMNWFRELALGTGGTAALHDERLWSRVWIKEIARLVAEDAAANVFANA